MKRRLHQHPHKKSAEAVPIAQRLRAESRKITGPRRAIIAVLEKEAHPLTIREIHECIGKSECDLATIYRSMHLLEKMRIVTRFDFGDAVARYELVRDQEDEHHHHLICTDCAKVVEIDECFPEELERKIAMGNGFADIRHKLEFFGVCPNCQEK
jgi:Fur family transcriptional regulator, ferric uptake regulator